MLYYFSCRFLKTSENASRSGMFFSGNRLTSKIGQDHTPLDFARQAPLIAGLCDRTSIGGKPRLNTFKEAGRQCILGIGTTQGASSSMEEIQC